MASCPKCGKRRLRKDALKRRFCRHCGLMRGIQNMDRSGALPICEPVNQEPKAAEVRAA